MILSSIYAFLIIVCLYYQYTLLSINAFIINVCFLSVYILLSIFALLLTYAFFSLHFIYCLFITRYELRQILCGPRHAEICLRAYADQRSLIGPSPSANRITGHYRKHQWRPNIQMRLCARMDESEYVHFSHARGNIFTWLGPFTIPVWKRTMSVWLNSENTASVWVIESAIVARSLGVYWSNWLKSLSWFLYSY